MLAMLLSLSPLLLRSPCRCGRAHRNAARRSPMPPPCSPFRHAAVDVLAVNARRAALAVPAAAMPAVLRSLCLPCCACCACRRHSRRAAVAHAGRRHARRAALAVPATATLAVPLWPGSPECCPTVAHAAAMLTLSPCCCRCACRECPPCCARCAGRRYARRAALAVPAAAILVVLLSLCRPPPCSSCCSRCAGRRHARHAALAVPATTTLAVPLWPGSPKCYPTVARAAAMLTISPCCCRSAGRRNARRAALAVPAAAMPAVLRSLCRPPPCSSCISRCPRYRYARRKAVAGLAEMLADGRPRR
ncbi:hypothetical protein PF003_g24145 [Phytophthora fragariae]|nr:hypothetical protein PF003_g24145 [Phytophthora fragariae]